MSTDHRRFRLEESLTQNNGKRSVFIEYMHPGAVVPPHFKPDITATLELLSGEATMYISEQAHSAEPDLDALEAAGQQMEIGKPMTAAPKAYHKVAVGGQRSVTRATLEPGSADFERLMMIMNGLARDGKLEEMNASLVFLAVVLDMSGTHPIGPLKQRLDEIIQENGKAIGELKADLLGKYDNKENFTMLTAAPEE